MKIPGSMVTLRPSDALNNLALLEQEIVRWKRSPERKAQIIGQLYYQGEHDIKHRVREAIGEEGKLEEVKNLPNNRLIDNQYAKLINQKANYLLGKPFTLECENQHYAKKLKTVLDKNFMRMLKNAGKATLNHGISWLYPHYTEDGIFSFRLFPGYEILPFWEDSDHTVLSGAVRLYQTIVYDDGISPTMVEKVEVFSRHGIQCYILDGTLLIPDTAQPKTNCAYVMANEMPLNWEKIPLIPLKCNDQEIPVIRRVKSLQDAINEMLSDFQNNMQEDARNTILVLTNYDGTNLGEFRRNLATYGAVKVRCEEGAKGGVDSLEITVDAENYRTILNLLKKAIIENGMGYDAKDERLSGTPNQLNIRSMYSDIDLDANEMETELQATFAEIFWFVNTHLANTGQGNFDGEFVNVIFNRDMLMDESEVISNIQNSVGILSLESLVAQHPWTTDKDAELKKLYQQEQRDLTNQEIAMFGR